MNFHPKVTAGAFAGAVVGMIIAEANRRGIVIDGTEAANITVLVSFVAGFFMPNGSASGSNGTVQVPPVVFIPPIAPPVLTPIPAATATVVNPHDLIGQSVSTAPSVIPSSTVTQMPLPPAQPGELR
jgi:hypothetical protein